MPGAAGREQEARLDVRAFQVGKIVKDLRSRYVVGQHLQDVDHTEAHATDARPATARVLERRALLDAIGEQREIALTSACSP